MLVWVTTAPKLDAEPLLFIAVSQTSDPTGQWSVKALTIKPSAATFKCTGSGQGSEEPFFVNYPQVKQTGVQASLVCSANAISCCIVTAQRDAITVRMSPQMQPAAMMAAAFISYES